MKTASILTLLLFIVSSCAKLGYYTEQGIGQAKIQWTGKKNEEVLKDPKVSEEHKHKIMLVEEYKKFFYHFFGKKSTNIYSKTTMLENKAVTYLVIASPHEKIEAHEFDFLFVGSFPYIGFYSKSSAKKWAENLEKKQNLVTWIRPVYAYSTLGILEDRILSSFFHYDDIELAELVFHELFHTIFFVKDDVELNENLANLYGKEMLQEYFKDRADLKNYMHLNEKTIEVEKRMVDLIGILQGEFAKLGGFIDAPKADLLTERFFTEVFRPDVQGLCAKLLIHPEDCELKGKWNQARFAAFLTYEEQQDFLEALKKELKLNLKEFLSWLNIEKEKFEDQDKIKSFTDYLKLKVPHATPATH